MLKALECDKCEHFLDLFLYLIAVDLLFAQREGNVLKNVQVRKQGVALEDGVDIALIGRHVVDVLAHEDNVALVRSLKAADEAQRRGLAASRGTQKREKLVVIDIKTDIVQHGLPVKGFGDVVQLNDFFHSPVLPVVKK